MMICGRKITIDPKLLEQLRAVPNQEPIQDEVIYEWYQSAEEYQQPLTVEEFQDWLVQQDVESACQWHDGVVESRSTKK